MMQKRGRIIIFTLSNNTVMKRELKVGIFVKEIPVVICSKIFPYTIIY